MMPDAHEPRDEGVCPDCGGMVALGHAKCADCELATPDDAYRPDPEAVEQRRQRLIAEAEAARARPSTPSVQAGVDDVDGGGSARGHGDGDGDGDGVGLPRESREKAEAANLPHQDLLLRRYEAGEIKPVSIGRPAPEYLRPVERIVYDDLRLLAGLILAAGKGYDGTVLYTGSFGVVRHPEYDLSTISKALRALKEADLIEKVGELPRRDKPNGPSIWRVLPGLRSVRKRRRA